MLMPINDSKIEQIFGNWPSPAGVLPVVSQCSTTEYYAPDQMSNLFEASRQIGSQLTDRFND